MNENSESVVFFEIDQPQCSLAYGVAPCAAALGVTGERKCFNTRATCQDPANFTPTKTVIDVYGALFGGASMGARASNLAGIANTKSGIFSAWVRFDEGSDGLSTTILYGYGPGTEGIFVAKEVDGHIFIEDNTGTGASFLLKSASAYLAGPAVHHIWASWNGATGAKHLYVDGVDDLDPASQANNVDTVYVGCTNWLISGSEYVETLIGAMGELYFAPGQYLDGAVAANRQKFRSAAGEPVNLGVAGATPTGTAPRIYLHLGYGQAADAFLANLGTGGAFVRTGERLSIEDLFASSTMVVSGVPNVLTLRFARAQEGLLAGAESGGLLLPSLRSLDTTPAAINLAAMDESASALGSREVVSVKCDDHLHSDLAVDPYRLGRIDGSAQDDAIGYDPYTRGTFWGKWLARNPYHQHLACRALTGTLEDGVLTITSTRAYVLDRIDGPTNGAVTLVAKDPFALIEAQKAVAPMASRGELAANITAVAGSAALLPAGIGALDYPASGYVVIGDEMIGFTRAADALTLTARHAFNSEADAHEAQDLVQVVLTYTSQLAHVIVYDLLVNYSRVDPASIDLVQWALDAAELTELYTAHIVEPTPVADLIGELAEQAGFTLWPEVETGMIRFVPLREQALTATVDDDGWIVEGTLSVKRAAARRVSQVWVYYAQINPVVKLDERRNFRSRVVTADPDAEGEDQYGTPAICEKFSRWIPQFGRAAAERIGSRILGMFRDPPMEVKFALHASREGALALARYFRLNTFEVQDGTGQMLDATFAAIEIERAEDEIQVAAQQVKFFTGGDVSGDRVIIIENDVDDLNLRTIHDSIYAAPLGTEVVRFVLQEGVTVGATTSAWAMRTGDWPAGVALSLEIEGRLAGLGGRSGRGGDSTGTALTAGAAGLPGGLALLAEYPITITGAGIIAGGGGGGGGGAGRGALGNERASGASGGGGAGRQVGVAAAPGLVDGPSPWIGGQGADGTRVAGGAPGGGVGSTGPTSGAGGVGGAPAQPGAAGSPGTAPVFFGAGFTLGGAGGAAGAAISGGAFVDVASSVTLQGDIDGATIVVPQIPVDAADFDFTNDAITVTGNLGATSTKQGIFSGWVRFDGNNAIAQILLEAAVSGVKRMSVVRGSDNKFAITTAGPELYLVSTNTFTAGATWRHVLASWDLLANVSHLYVTDANENAAPSLVNTAIDFTAVTKWAIGEAATTAGNTRLDGCLAEIYFAPGQYLDFSVVANRRKFIDALGKPADLGFDGAVPTGVAPVIYQHLLAGEAPANFRLNRGSGGDFTVTGALTTASSSPS